MPTWLEVLSAFKDAKRGQITFGLVQVSPHVLGSQPLLYQRMTVSQLLIITDSEAFGLQLT